MGDMPTARIERVTPYDESDRDGTESEAKRKTKQAASPISPEIAEVAEITEEKEEKHELDTMA